MRAFTLIEVIVSVIILFISTFIFFSFTSNSIKLYNLFEKQKKFSLISSVVFCEERGGNLKEILKDFNIKNDSILRALDKKVELKKSVDLKSDFNATWVVLFRLKAYDKHNSSFIYSLEVK